MDKLQAIKFFLNLSDTLSFKQTAIQFGVPPSTVSRAIKALESELGVELFERTTRHVRLTEAGSWYGSEVADAVRDLAAADSLVRTESRQAVGTVRITAVPGYGEIRLNRVLDAFRKAYPQVVCEVELTDRFLDLSTGEIDVALRATADPPDYLVARRLHSNRWIMVASPDYLSRNGRPAAPDEIINHKTLAYRGPNGVLPWLFRRSSGDVVQVPSNPIMATNHGMHLLNMVCSGEGLVMLPRWGVGDQLRDGSLEEVTVEGGEFMKLPGPETSVYLLYDPRKVRLGKVRALVDFLVAELTDDQSELDSGPSA